MTNETTTDPDDLDPEIIGNQWTTTKIRVPSELEAGEAESPLAPVVSEPSDAGTRITTGDGKGEGAMTKDSSEYGWQVISRSSYEKLHAMEYAGPGTPLHPERPGCWVMSYEADRGTVLYTGVTIDETF